MSEKEEGKKEGGFLGGVRESLGLWLKDLFDVVITLTVILVVLRLLLGAQMLVPLVVVTSGSMTHYHGDYSWIVWLNERGVGNETISSMPLTGGFKMGDMIVVERPEVSVGDVVVYDRDFVYGGPGVEPIIHRVVGVVYVNDGVVVGSDGTLDCFVLEDFDRYVSYVDDCRENKQGCRYPAVPKSDSYRFYITKGDANPSSDQCIQRSSKISIPVNEAQVPAKAFLRLPYVGWLKLTMNGIIKVLTLQF